MDRRLVDHLVNSSLVSRAVMQRMILRASKDKSSIVEQLFADPKVDEESLARELASYYGLGLVAPSSFSVNETALKFISKSMADKHGVLPFAISEAADHVTVAVCNPESAQSVLESLKTATGRDPAVEIAPREWLKKAIRHFYFGDPWPEAPAHGAATREVADVSEDYRLNGVGVAAEESSEIVLDEVVVPPAPRPRAKRTTPAADEPDQTPIPRQRRRSQAPQPQEPPASARRSSRAGAGGDGEVEAALDDFESFLDNATGWGNRSGAAGIPGWDDGGEPVDPFSLDAGAPDWDEPAASPGRNGGSGFNLFDERSEGKSSSVQATLDDHGELIDQLRREIQQQRDIITALVDALSDAGVVSKRDIKQRVKRK